MTVPEAQNQLIEWMKEDLPNITNQKKYIFRPTKREINKTYNILNLALYDGKLIRPKIKTTARGWYWGLCQVIISPPKKYKSKSSCEILLSNKWFCRQWFIDTLAHEMAHQYQWDIDGPIRLQQGKEPLMSHGPSFFKHKCKIDQFGLNLKVTHRIKKWFKYQSLSKC